MVVVCAYMLKKLLKAHIQTLLFAIQWYLRHKFCCYVLCYYYYYYYYFLMLFGAWWWEARATNANSMWSENTYYISTNNLNIYTHNFWQLKTSTLYILHFFTMTTINCIFDNSSSNNFYFQLWPLLKHIQITYNILHTTS